MLPIFLIISMAILAATTIIGIVSNCLILTINMVEKIKGMSLGSSDLILVTLGISNITFQFVMTANDFLSFLWSDLYFSDRVYSVFNALLFLPVFSSFWFTVCLCVYYCLQIVIFTHPFLMRLKLGISTLVPCFLVTSVLTSVAISVPAVWSTYRDQINENITGNQSLEINVPKLNITYLLPSNIIGCSLPLLLVAISNGLILRSLASPKNKVEKASKANSPRAEARERAARTVGCLLILYLSFYISEIIMFVDLFPPSSPGFCVCLIFIYTYSPAQSLILILGSPKLKKALLSLLRLCDRLRNEDTKIPKIIFVELNSQKTPDYLTNR
ncbi:taste receptor type 2 member 40-like [Spea bombifrons]|uniref:taste receptor type 2 member 40-like n=1 Tax=Spea bombifrons TaxID=233779 RepID=UPI00234A3379|nr:taste receptor type 2 member 40-like [Spea bombifrons]